VGCFPYPTLWSNFEVHASFRFILCYFTNVIGPDLYLLIYCRCNNSNLITLQTCFIVQSSSEFHNRVAGKEYLCHMRNTKFSYNFCKRSLPDFALNRINLVNNWDENFYETLLYARILIFYSHTEFSFFLST
jgi:hypothetical protein